MPLPNPILDDRSFQQLYDELVSRIPVYTREWTDHNPSDPGITLIELFAFLGENLLFRFNQIPEATKLAYLRLLQLPLRPAAPARAMVTMSTETVASAGVLVENGSEVKAGNLSFATCTEVAVLPVSIVGVGRLRTADPDRDRQPEVFEFALRAIDALGGLQAGQDPAYYEAKTIPEEGEGEVVDL